MRKHTLIKRAAVVACSAALVANPAMALAAEGASAQPVTLAATQATASHGQKIHNYDDDNNDVFAKLWSWWPKGISAQGFEADYDQYRLTSGSTQYGVRRNSETFTPSSGTYAVEGGIGQGITDVRWRDLGTFTVNRYWELDVDVDGAPDGAGGLKVGSTTVGSGVVEVNEDVVTTVTPVAVPGYEVSVALDGAPVALDANGSFVIPARSGQGGMRDSDIDVVYSKRQVELSFDAIGAVSYNPNKEELLGEILDKIFESNFEMRDSDTNQLVAGVTKDDLSVSYDGELNAGEHQIALSYKGTIGGAESVYAPDAWTFDVAIDPATITLSWAQELGEATGAYRGQVDGVLSQGDAQTFDFAAADSGVPGATFKTLFYRGVGDDKTLLGEDAPSEPGLYTEVVTMTDASGNYFASPLTRTFAIEGEAGANPGSGKADPAGGETEPSDKKDDKKTKATLPKTGDTLSMAVPLAAGAAGVAAFAAAVATRKRRDR